MPVIRNIIPVVIALYAVTSVHAASSFRYVRHSYARSDTVLLDRRGEPLYELRTNRQVRALEWTSIQDVSPSMIKSVVTAEDKRFYEHSGVDYKALASALAGFVKGGKIRGASTITMQLASALNPELQPVKGRRSLWQKTKQVLEARDIEKLWSKDQILEAYLNLVFFRSEFQGIMAASRGLFGKNPHGLNRGESLVLASLIRSPNAGGADIEQRACKLAKALHWRIKRKQIRSVVAQVITGPVNIGPVADLAPHAARLLIKKPSKKKRVYCSLVRSIQKYARDRLEHHITILGAQNVTNGAVLVLENKTGRVVAYVSYTSDPDRGWYVDGIRGKRQAGSTLKPFLYALAFEKKMLTPASILEDRPLDIPVATGIYRPRNYDNDFKGLVSARVALASSLNIPAVRTISMTGIEPLLAKLRKLNIEGITESGDYYGPSLALGSLDVSLWELTNAYRCLANGGLVTEATFSPEVLKKLPAARVYSREAAFIISDILSDREARSATFGLENHLCTRFWTAVKTGTSKDMRDNWCVGYSRKYTVGVWVGNFNGEAMQDVSGISGAAPVWSEVMTVLHQGEDFRPLTPVSDKIVSKQTGSRHAGMPEKKEYFLKGTQPDERNRTIGQLNQRIIYPPAGTIIALDPDIPPGLQKVFFIAEPYNSSCIWLLNGTPISVHDSAVPNWAPESGSYTLSLCDGKGNIIDSVRFQVRGPSKKKKKDDNNAISTSR